MKTLKALQEERTELLEKAEVIQARIEAAEKDGKEPEAQDSADWSELMGKDGLVAKNQADIDRATEIEQQRKALASAKARAQEATSHSPLSIQTSGTQEPVIAQHRVGPLKAFKGENAVRNAYEAGMFLRAIVARAKRGQDEKAEQFCASRGWPVLNVQTEGQGASGGYLVPDPISQTIIDVRSQVGIARRIARVVPMTADTLSMPKRTGGLTVYAPGEAQTITTSDKSWGRVNLVAKKRAVATKISQELIDDALISIVDDAMNEMAYALALQEDNEIINGDGTQSTYFGVQGILNKIGSAGVATATTGNDTWPELSTTDVANWFGKLPDKYRQRGSLAIVCSSNFYHTALLRILMSGGGNAIADLQAGEADARFMGYPVYFTDRMPTATAAATVSALLINTREAVMIGERVGVRMGMSADYAFLDDVTTLMATVRYDINVFEPGDSSNAGAVVALKTAS